MANKRDNKTKNPNIKTPKAKAYAIRLTDEEFERVLQMMRYYKKLDFSKTVKMCLENQYQQMSEAQHGKNS